MECLERLTGKLTQQDKKNIQWIVKNIPGCIYYKDNEGYYFACSDYLIQDANTYRNAQEIIGKTDYDLFTKDQADSLRKNDIQVMEQASVMSFEEEITLPNDNKKYYQVFKSPLWNEHGQVVGVIGNSIDITNKKIIEKLEKEKYAAEKQMDVLRMMAASIAHELRTPITAAQFAATGIKRYLPKLIAGYHLSIKEMSLEAIPENKLKILEEALASQERQLRNCHHLIDVQLKNVSVNEIDKSKFSPLIIEDLIQQAIEEYPIDNRKEKLIINSLCDNSIVCTEPTLFKHVIWNLLKNAIYFIDAEGKGNITIWSELVNGQIIIYFKDTGKGISPSQATKVFDRFYSQRPEGTGLGLSFCQLVIEASNGTITCEGKEGEYALFKIVLPLCCE